MVIFSAAQRDDLSPHAYSETLSSFLNRSGRPAFEVVRNSMNSWFSDYCVEEQAGLRRALLDGDDRQFLAAFWELFLHATLNRAFERLTCHPTLPGTSRRPDFEATRSGESSIIEARLAWRRREQTAKEARIARVFDAVNDVNCPAFLLGVDVDSIGTIDPPFGQLRTHLQQWLDSLDADFLFAQWEAEDADPARTRWSHDGWDLSFEAIPLAPEHRNYPDHRPIGTSASGGGLIDGVSPVKKALRDKSRAYGEHNGPFLIAIRTDWDTDQAAMMSVLFGTDVIRYTQNLGPENRVWRERLSDGFWSQGRNRHVSGVLVCSDLMPWTVARAEPVLWKNPNATYPFPLLPSWRGMQLAADGVLTEEAPAISTAEYLGLSEGWPGQW
jgi:hypothetical protein